MQNRESIVDEDETVDVEGYGDENTSNSDLNHSHTHHNENQTKINSANIPIQQHPSMDTEDNTITSLSSFQGAWEKKNRMELSLNCKLIQTHKFGFIFQFQ